MNAVNVINDIDLNSYSSGQVESRSTYNFEGVVTIDCDNSTIYCS